MYFRRNTIGLSAFLLIHSGLRLPFLVVLARRVPLGPGAYFSRHGGGDTGPIALSGDSPLNAWGYCGCGNLPNWHPPLRDFVAGPARVVLELLASSHWLAPVGHPGHVCFRTLGDVSMVGASRPLTPPRPRVQALGGSEQGRLPWLSKSHGNALSELRYPLWPRVRAHWVVSAWSSLFLGLVRSLVACAEHIGRL